MARTYKRDSSGRFAGGGGGSGGGKRPAARSVSRGTNRLTRDNAGKITSVGGNGATARGGRLRTAAGNQRATQTARVKGGGAGAGTIKGTVKRNPQAGAKLAGRGKVSPQSNRLAKAQANVERLKNQSPKPGTRRLDSQQIRRQLKADRAVEIYNASPDKRKQIIRNTPPARTERAKQNWMQTRDARLQNAKLAGLPLVTVGRKPRQSKKTDGPLAVAAAKLRSDLATAKGSATKAGARVKYKTAVRRAIKTDRSSVIPSNPTGAKRIKLAKPSSTIARPRTQGNSTAVVSGRVQRRLAAATANLKNITRYGNVANQRQYDKLLRRETTLRRASNYLQTGKLPGKNNSMAKQREFKVAVKKLDAKNNARRLASRVRR